MPFRYSVAGPSTTYVSARTRHEISQPHCTPTSPSGSHQYQYDGVKKPRWCEYCFLSAFLKVTFVQIAR